ncbi:hypothetical protein ACFQZS_16500 [Mucilaginibacter calamicampi]|uniref:Uncharacterized protein n=1 Tax=Mucilaginibacter calamicampi TaxID=1302352 RepID=A0ABW2YZ70_9SPHI
MKKRIVTLLFLGVFCTALIAGCGSSRRVSPPPAPPGAPQG